MLRIKIRNYEAIKELDIQFDGIVGIYGPTHAGKSSLVRAVQSLLTGNIPKEAYHRNRKPVEIALESSYGTVLLKKDTSVNYFVNGHEYAKIGRENPIPILEEINLKPYIVDGKVFYPWIQAQLTSLFGISNSPATLYSFLSGNTYYRDVLVVKKEIEQESRALKKEVTKLQGTKTYLENKISTYKNIRRSLSSLEDVINIIQINKENRRKLQSFIKDLGFIRHFSEQEKVYSKFLDRLDLVESLIGKYEIVNKALQYVQSSIAFTKFINSVPEKKLKKLAKLVKQHQQLVEYIKGLSDLENLILEIEDLEIDIQEIETEYNIKKCSKCGAPTIGGKYYG